MDMSTTLTSHHLFERAKKAIPGGVNSPVRSFKHVGMDPIFFEKGRGASLFDVEGKEYTDFCLSFGPHLLGHSHPAVVKAIQEQAEKATSFGACHAKEVELAEWVLKAYPFLDRVRLVNSGTEAVMTALRIARGFTGRNKILKFEGCYHGHADGLLVKAGSGVAELSQATSRGVPATMAEETLVARFDQLETVEAAFKRYGNQIAAVIVEPIPANHGLWLPDRARLEEICAIANRAGALVIFDEVISGFRVGFGGAAAEYDLKPDLVTLGKILGGGLPLAAVAGRRDVMESLAPLGAVYQAGTLSGNPLATAAGCAVLSVLDAEKPYPYLKSTMQWFAKELETLLAKFAPVKMVHHASLFWFQLGDADHAFPPAVTPRSHELYTQFFKICLREKIYLAPSPYEVGFISTAHHRSVLEGVLERLRACPELK